MAGHRKALGGTSMRGFSGAHNTSLGVPGCPGCPESIDAKAL